MFGMFGMLSSLTKAVVAVAVSPVAVVVDTIMLPADAENRGEAYSRTGALLKSAGDNVSKAIDSDN